MIRKAMLSLALVGFATLTAAPTAAYAGEWSPGRQEHNGAAGHAASACVFNGRDDNDPEDDELWAQTPSKGKVQSGGQLVAAGFGAPGVQGQACNPNSGFEE